MKSTGIIRKVDELGRVVIPIELRNKFEISEKRIFKSEEKEADKTIKRTLRKIKNR